MEPFPLTIDTPLTRMALAIATKAHEGQTRNDKKTPFITHPIAVANKAVELYRNEGPIAMKRECELITIVGSNHDAPEDVAGFTNWTLLDQLKANNLIEYSEAILIDNALNRLNKHNYPDYCAFTLAAKEFWLSAIVKRADIWHNSQTITKGSLADKYKLALWVLEH